MQANESFAKAGVLKSVFLCDQGRSVACDWLKGFLWDIPGLHFYREVNSGCIKGCQGSDTT